MSKDKKNFKNGEGELTFINSIFLNIVDQKYLFERYEDDLDSYFSKSFKRSLDRCVKSMENLIENERIERGENDLKKILKDEIS